MPVPGSNPGIEPGIQRLAFGVEMAGSSPAMTRGIHGPSSRDLVLRLPR